MRGVNEEMQSPNAHRKLRCVQLNVRSQLVSGGIGRGWVREERTA